MNILQKWRFQVKTFKKSNSVLFWSFWVAICICMSYILTPHEAKSFPEADKWFNLLFQLAVGFIINFMFYITQVYIPRYKQNIEVNRCISARISTIIHHMRSVFEELGKIYMNGYDENNITDKYLLDLLEKINSSDRINVLNSGKAIPGHVNNKMYFTVKEWIISRVDFIEKEIDKIFQYYAQFITPELMKTLESIQRSPMHLNMVRMLLQMPICPSFKGINQDIFMKPYYEQMKKLETIKSNYASE